MDPATLIIGALAAGAAAAGQETAGQMIKDAYAGLKALIKKRFAEKKAPEGEIALTKYEEKPDVWEAPLRDALVETETHKAAEVLEAAETLQQALERTPEGRDAFSRCIHIQNSQVGVIGDKYSDIRSIITGDSPEPPIG